MALIFTSNAKYSTLNEHLLVFWPCSCTFLPIHISFFVLFFILIRFIFHLMIATITPVPFSVNSLDNYLKFRPLFFSYPDISGFRFSKKRRETKRVFPITLYDASIERNSFVQTSATGDFLLFDRWLCVLCIRKI